VPVRVSTGFIVQEERQKKHHKDREGT